MTQINLYKILGGYGKKNRLKFEFVQPFFCDCIPSMTDLWDITNENQWQLGFLKFVSVVGLVAGYPKEVIACTKSEFYLLRMIKKDNIGKKLNHKFDRQRKHSMARADADLLSTKNQSTPRKRNKSMFIMKLAGMGIQLQVKEPILPEKKKHIPQSVCSKGSKNLDRIAW